MLKHAFYSFLLFMLGGVAVMNLTYLRYGIPSHYSGGWGKVIFVVVAAIIIGILLVRHESTRST